MAAGEVGDEGIDHRGCEQKHQQYHAGISGPLGALNERRVTLGHHTAKYAPEGHYAQEGGQDREAEKRSPSQVALRFSHITAVGTTNRGHGHFKIQVLLSRSHSPILIRTKDTATQLYSESLSLP